MMGPECPGPSILLLFRRAGEASSTPEPDLAVS